MNHQKKMAHQKNPQLADDECSREDKKDEGWEEPLERVAVTKETVKEELKRRRQSLPLEGLTFRVGNSWLSLGCVGFHSVQPSGSCIASSTASKFTCKHCGG